MGEVRFRNADALILDDQDALVFTLAQGDIDHRTGRGILDGICDQIRCNGPEQTNVKARRTRERAFANDPVGGAVYRLKFVYEWLQKRSTFTNTGFRMKAPVSI